MKKKYSFFLKNILANLILIWGSFTIYQYSHFYRSFLTPSVREILFYIAVVYSLITIGFEIQNTKENKYSKGRKVLNIVIQIVKKLLNHLNNKQDVGVISFNQIKKTELLFFIVKFFFTPIMLNSFIQNFKSVQIQLSFLANYSSQTFIHFFNNNLYFLLLSVIFMVDTYIFLIGYLVEHKKFKNTIIAVESTALGWFVALICYPPFNSFAANIIPWSANDQIYFFNENATFVFRIILIILISFYVSASIFLGTKASNLTSRGVITTGPYSIVRHPAYVSKVIFWWITIIPIYSNIYAIFGMLFWTFIYILRAFTEERLLISSDPNYKMYCQKVKYRFIPFII